MNKNEKYSRLAFYAFNRFYEMTQAVGKPIEFTWTHWNSMERRCARHATFVRNQPNIARNNIGLRVGRSEFSVTCSEDGNWRRLRIGKFESKMGK